VDDCGFATYTCLLFPFLCFSAKPVKCLKISTLQLSPTVQGGKRKSRRKKGKESEPFLNGFRPGKNSSEKLGLWLLAVSEFRGFRGFRPKRKKIPDNHYSAARIGGLVLIRAQCCMVCA
jgi:hypothetical protein